MKEQKVILIYDSRNSRNELDDIVNMLTQHALADVNCTVETCALFNAKENLEKEYDMAAGYHISVEAELSLCQKFVNKYLHFFDSHHMFSFAHVTKREEMGGYNTYTISTVSV